MDALDLTKDKIAYNQWANSIMINWLKGHKTDLFEEKVISSFPTVNKLLHHMMEAEKYYFSLLRKSEETYVKDMATDDIFEELLRMDQELLGWISEQDASLMDKIISLKRSPFIEKYSIATIINHMVNHSTYHRGQLIALRHQLGFSEAPKVDYYRFFIDRKR